MIISNQKQYCNFLACIKQNLYKTWSKKKNYKNTFKTLVNDKIYDLYPSQTDPGNRIFIITSPQTDLVNSYFCYNEIYKNYKKFVNDRIKFVRTASKKRLRQWAELNFLPYWNKDTEYYWQSSVVFTNFIDGGTPALHFSACI